MKKNTPNRHAQALRQQLGVKQDRMALWLGVGRSLFSMYESKERSLPAPALLKLASFYHEWEAFQKTWNPDPNPESMARSEPDPRLLRKINQLETKLMKAERAWKTRKDLPDLRKAKAFFESLLPKVASADDPAFFQEQIHYLNQKIKQEEKEKNRLILEIESISSQLAALKKQAG